MQKTYRSETSVNMVFDTVRSNSNRLNPGARKTNINMRVGSSGATAPRPMFGQKLQSSKNIESKKFTFFPVQKSMVHDPTDEAGSVGSPKTSLFNVPGNMATKNKMKIGAGKLFRLQEEHMERLNAYNTKNEGDLNEQNDNLLKVNRTKYKRNSNTRNGMKQLKRDVSPDYHNFTSREKDQVHSVNMLRHFIFSRRSIRGKIEGGVLHEYSNILVAEESLEEIVKHSTLEKGVKSPTSFEFTLGRSLGPALGVVNQPAGTLGNHAFKANLNCQVSARKGDQRGSLESEKMFFDNSPTIHEYSKTNAGLY